MFNPQKLQGCSLLSEPAMATPLHCFLTTTEFEARHKAGTEAEEQYQREQIEDFNDENIFYDAWLLAKTDSSGTGQDSWLFAVFLNGKVNHLLHRQEKCEIQIFLGDPDGDSSKFTDICSAERATIPVALMSKLNLTKFVAYEVKCRSGDSELIQNLFNSAEQDDTRLLAPRKVRVRFTISYSDRTTKIELKALRYLMTRAAGGPTRNQQIFKYLMDFQKPDFVVNLFAHYPWMDPSRFDEFNLPSALTDLYKHLDGDQQAAYNGLLSKLPCSVGMLPGGPGAGKTHWNLTVLALALAKPRAPAGQRLARVRLLYILDINEPLNDVGTKLVRLSRRLKLCIRALRAHHWRYDFNKIEMQITDECDLVTRWHCSRYFLALAKSKAVQGLDNDDCEADDQCGECRPRTLDEAAYIMYWSSRTQRCARLATLLASLMQGPIDDKSDEYIEFANRCVDLYLRVLDWTDVILATPCVASAIQPLVFSPQIVFFDESAHARELSVMIAIAKFNSRAFIFSGDHRQIRPFVATNSARDNKWAAQMGVSTMKRASHCGGIKHQLLLNHRAHGGLERLAARLFYNKEMRAASSFDKKSIQVAAHVRKEYLMPFVQKGSKLDVARLAVHVVNAKPMQYGTSWANLGNLEFIIAMVKRLIKDDSFKKVGFGADHSERGTILIIAPYREAILRYKDAVRELNSDAHIDVRTVDTSQGHEADFVFVDFVRDVANDFLDDPHRLCVSITRGRQAEILVTNPSVAKMRSGTKTKYLSRILDDVHVVRVVRSQSDGPFVREPVQEPKQKPEQEVTAGSEPGVNADEQEVKSETDEKSKAESGQEVKPESEQEAKAEHEHKSEPMQEPDQDCKPEHDQEAKPESEKEPMPKPDAAALTNLTLNE